MRVLSLAQCAQSVQSQLTRFVNEEVRLEVASRLVPILLLPLLEIASPGLPKFLEEQICVEQPVGADSRHEVQIMLLQFRALRFGYRPHLGESGVCLGDCITRRTDIRVGAVGVNDWSVAALDHERCRESMPRIDNWEGFVADFIAKYD